MVRVLLKNGGNLAKRNKLLKILIQVGLGAVVLALIVFALNSVLPGFIDVLANGQQGDVQEYLNSFHDFSGYAIGFLLQFVQIITIFLPSVPIQVAVGVIFGTWRGFLVCYMGYISANAVIFIAVRKLGEKLEQLLPGKTAEKKNAKKKNFIMDAKYPAFNVFFASILPVIPNGLIPYVASKTKISFRSYMLAVMTGCIPTVLTLCAVGDQLVDGDFLSAALYVAPLLIFAGLLLWQRKNIIALYEKMKQKAAR